LSFAWLFLIGAAILAGGWADAANGIGYAWVLLGSVGISGIATVTAHEWGTPPRRIWSG
jgi:hypothetical protein